MEHQPKLNEKYLHFMSSFEGTTFNNLHDTATEVILFLTFCFKFSFLMDSVKPLTPLKSQNLLSATEFLLLVPC